MSGIDLKDPIPFIVSTESENGERKFAISDEAIAFLSDIEDLPVSVISVAGLYRTGKSAVLNQLRGGTHGFNVGSTIESCTRGLWLWNVSYNAEQNEKYPTLGKCKTLLLDTEGLGSYDQDATYDIQIFSFALLLGSFFIYNSLGTIDETALDRLSLVVELTKYIRTRSGSAGEDAHSLKAYFPSFLWLLRDFSLQLEADGKQLTAKQYMENCLKPVPERKGASSAAAEKKNSVREHIRDFFNDRDCYTMRRPVSDESLLQKIGELPMDQLRPEYLDELAKLSDYIFNRVQVKKIHGQALNGPMFLRYAQTYIDAINSQSFPTIQTAWQNVVEHEAAKAKASAREFFSCQMDLLVPSSASSLVHEEEDLEKAYNMTADLALTKFKDRAVGDGDYKLQQLEELRAEFHDLYATRYRERNLRSSDVLCTSLAEASAVKLRETRASADAGDGLNMDSAKVVISSVVEEYLSKAKGPCKHSVLARFWREEPVDLLRRTCDHLVADAVAAGESKVVDAQKRAQEEMDRANDLMRALQRQFESEQHRSSLLDAANSALEERVRQRDRDIDDLRRDIQTLREEKRKVEEQKREKEEEEKKLRATLSEAVQHEEIVLKEKTLVEQDKARLQKELESTKKQATEWETKAKKSKCLVM